MAVLPDDFIDPGHSFNQEYLGFLGSIEFEDVVVIVVVVPDEDTEHRLLFLPDVDLEQRVICIEFLVEQFGGVFSCLFDKNGRVLR